MKRHIVTAILILICFLLQSSVLTAFHFGGIIPNLLIIFTASFGFMNGRKTGLLIGFFCGLLMDTLGSSVTILNQNILGFYALLYMYIGYINGVFRRIFYPEDIKLPLLLILGSDISLNLVCYFFMFFMRGKLQFFFYLMHVIIPEAVYTILLALLAYPLFLWIQKRLDAGEQRSTT